MKIDIQINDVKRLTDVALVVDQDYFLIEIKALRKTYKITQLLLQEEYIKFRKDIYFKPNQKNKLKSDIENIRKKLRLPHSFLRVIEKATFCGVITEKDYLPAYLERDTSSFDKNGNEPDDKYYIVLSPQARDKDVIDAFQSYRDSVNNWLNSKVFNYRFIWVPNEKIVKRKPSIKDHRQWYQSLNSGMSFKEIELECIDSCPIKTTQPSHKTGKGKPSECRCFDESTIRKGVENYKSLLRKSRTL